MFISERESTLSTILVKSCSSVDGTLSCVGIVILLSEVLHDKKFSTNFVEIECEMYQVLIPVP